MFQQGQSGNPAGKKKGTLNKKSREWAELGEAIKTKHAKRFNAILEDLDNEKFLDKFLQVLEYFQPKQQRVVSENHNINENIEVTLNLDPLETNLQPALDNELPTSDN